MLYFKLPVGKVGIALPRYQGERLQGTCFRGKQERKAGNFSRWSSFDEMMLDTKFQLPLCEILNDILLENGLPKKSYVERMSLSFKESIGWSSTIPSEYAQNVPNERRQLNKQSEALFISDESILAPLTNIVTLVVEIRADQICRLDAVVLVQTIYPGTNVGPLAGDMTASTGLFWFNRNHPGGNNLIEVDL